MELLGAQVEVWKKIVDVQQHFNDLELRIRNFAIVVTGAFLGLGGYAIKDGSATSFAGYSAASLIIGASLFPLIAFYLMDRFWYHRLLDGSVKAGSDAEAKLKELGVQVDLGSQISKASPFKLFGCNVHSRHKMDGFYGLLGIAIIVAAVTLWCKGKHVEAVSPPPVAQAVSPFTMRSGHKKAPPPAAEDTKGEAAASKPATASSISAIPGK